MIKITFVEPTTRTWRRWRKDCEKETDALVASVRAGNAPVIKEGLYKRKSIKNGVFFCKSGPFRAKCVYCESYLDDFQRGDVEHFRPKMGVTDENDAPVYLTDENGNKIVNEANDPIPHPGYYWLAYEWTNLLPACTFCNQPTSLKIEIQGETVDRKIGKHCRFPVEGRHSATPNEIQDERPLLINPVETDPSQHLDVDIENGLMKHRTPPGEMCIRIFALNERDRLPEKRRMAILEISATLDKITHNADPIQQRRALDELKEILAGKHECTAAARAKYASWFPFFRELLM
jgi:hypothetical protein